MVQTLKAKESNWKNPPYRNRQIAGTLFALPAILGFLIFVITPMILSLYYSLTDFSVFKEKTTFLGFENYRKLLDGSDPFFYKSLKATLYFVVLNVPATIIFSFLLALLLNRNIKGRALFQRHFLYAVDHSDRGFLHDLAVPAQSGSRTGEQHSQVAGTVQEHVAVR